ncbi:MAG: hypothetical protein QUU85_08965, partial [Candidatus Eisenbacteria bacterium]|nr:hypothetical protein [Candidatus Eisenbacteria bacterium]
RCLVGSEMCIRDSRNPNLQMGCHKEAIAYVSSKRDSFPPEDGRILGDAMLSLADHSSYPPGVRSQIEMAAAYLSSEDSILTRIRAYAGSSSPALQALATDMMAESRDPRANRLLLDQLAKYRKGDVPPPGRLLIAAGMKMKGSAYDALLAIFRETTDAELRRAALQGLAYSGDARAIGLLLEEYGDDQTGIRDSASSIPDRAELGRYQDLWYCTRLLEPTLIPALLGSDKSLSLQALELIDRESRFGLAAGNEGMLTALRDFAAKADQDTALVRRAVETAGRFQRWEAEKGRGR